jgi:hypothetical protein
LFNHYKKEVVCQHSQFQKGPVYFLFPSVFNDFFKPRTAWFDAPEGAIWGNVLQVPAINSIDIKMTAEF